MRIVLPSTFWLDFRGSQALQKACQMDPKITKNVGTNQKIRESKKLVKTDCQKVGKSVTTRQNGVSEKLPFCSFFSMKNDNLQKFVKMAPLGVPGSKRHPKGIQKASRRVPKVFQKA